MMSEDLDYIEDWKKYREKRALLESKMCKGGSIYSIVYTYSLIDTTRTFIKELKIKYKQFLRK